MKRLFPENPNGIGHRSMIPCSRPGDRDEPRTSELNECPGCVRQRLSHSRVFRANARSAVWVSGVFALLTLPTCRPKPGSAAGSQATADVPVVPAPASPEIRLEYSSGWGFGYVLELDAKAGKWHFTDRKTSRRQTADESSAATQLTCFIKALEAIPEPGGLMHATDSATYRFTVHHGEKHLVRRFGSPSIHFMFRALDSPSTAGLEKEIRDAVEAQKKEAWEELKSHWTAFYLEMEIDRVLITHFPDSGFGWKPKTR